MSKVLNDAHLPSGTQIHPPPPPSHSYPELRIPDCWRYTIHCLWLDAICEVCFPRYDQRLITRNESLRRENQKNNNLELHRGFTVTPHETSRILSLNYNDLNTDYTLGHCLWSTFTLPHAVLPISSGHSNKQTLSRDVTMQLRDTPSRSSKKA